MSYKISFTSGGLFSRDAIKVAELYLLLQDWNEVRRQVIEQNLLQARAKSSLVRTVNELVPRIQILTAPQLEILVDGSRQEQRQILWLAACKQYRFVHDFAVEVLREKYVRLDWQISYTDFDVFYFDKAEWHEELAKVTESTRKKLRQVLFRMMLEAEIISSANLILPAILSIQMIRAISKDNNDYFFVFPISETDLRQLRS